MNWLYRAIFGGSLLAGLLSPMAAYGQAPPPVPALPDNERRTSYSIPGTKCVCAVNFAIYGDSTDVDEWIEVWIGGARKLSTDPTFGWALSSATGSLATIPRPITDAVLTFNANQTGTVQIVGARRPRRTTQFQENRGVAARDLNQVLTDLTAQNREIWDKINDVTGRGLFSQPGNVVGPLPLPAACAGEALTFDATGLVPICVPIGSISGGGTVGAGAANSVAVYALTGTAIAGTKTLPVGLTFGPGTENIPAQTPTLEAFLDGSQSGATPQGTTQPSVAISRYEALTLANTAGGQNAALHVDVQSNSSAATQATGIATYSTMSQAGGGDSTALLAVANEAATNGSGAFGGFFQATATGAGAVAWALETAAANSTGSDQPWTVGGGVGAFSGFCDCTSTGANLATAGIALRASGNQFDVGFGAHTGSVKTAFAQDDSSSITVLKATQTHTHGIDLSGATLSSDAFKSSGFTVDGGGNIVNTTVTSGSVLANSTGGVGYKTGAGNAVTQLSSRTTGVTINNPTGNITLFSAAGSATPTSFTVTNSAVGANDVIVISEKSGTDLYVGFATAVAAGSFKFTFIDDSGTTVEAPVFNFVVIKGSNN